MLKVTFIGEPAIDDGGPRREFFSGMYIQLTKYTHISCNFILYFATETLEQVGRRLLRDGFPVVNMAALSNEEFKEAMGKLWPAQLFKVVQHQIS